jgi:prephenate dehydrogenase
VAASIVDSIEECVSQADLVILAPPICTFEDLFREIASLVRPGCIVTDVGSTKSMPHRWASKILNNRIHYVGSHPIAGSEKQGVEFARDDLFDHARCILTRTRSTNAVALRALKEFWTQLGCMVNVMSPAQHDRIFGRVSHLPHATAAALINASDPEELRFAGRGFIDTSRVASGPANIWTDIFLTNSENTVRGIGKVIRELERLQKVIKNHDRRGIEDLLTRAREKRSKMIERKVRNKELI